VSALSSFDFLRHGARPLLAVVMAIAGAVLMSAPALASDDYTLPFYDPGVSLNYGVDRDPRIGIQLDYTGKVWYDTATHPGRVYDNHSGLDYPMPVYSPVAAAKDGVVAETEGGYGTRQFGDFGNFVRLRHSDGRHTLYYHLASRADGGIAVSYNEDVIAGEKVGESGCSGICYGPHLHFEVMVDMDGDLVTSDPMFRRLWTTWPGRIPFRAAYVRENDADTVIVRRGYTIYHWVEFKNIGGRTWRPNIWPGRVVLGTWDPAQHDSMFAASDWTNDWIATRVDGVTAPDEVGRFTFGIRGAPGPGTYREDFNLDAQGAHWFNWDELGGFYVPIKVTQQIE
jgi:murein DD-endopeptidase MepM/ murein hydrolase activator NlpD